MLVEVAYGDLTVAVSAFCTVLVEKRSVQIDVRIHLINCLRTSLL